MLINSRTNITTTMAIVTYTTAWLKSEYLPRIEMVIPEANENLKDAIKSQNSIGWDQFFCGRISKKWERVYQEDLDKIDTGLYKQTTDKWGRNIVELTYELVLNCWSIRNELEYEENNTESETTKKKKIIRKIIWNIGKIGDAIDHPYRTTSRDELEDMPMANIEMIDEQLVTIFNMIKRNNEGVGQGRYNNKNRKNNIHT